MTNAVLGDSLEDIGACAFRGCGALSAVVGGAGVANIGEEAFARCTALAEALLPDGLKRIGNGAFAGCDALEAVGIPDLASWCRIGFGDAEANPMRRARVFAGGVEVGGDVAVPEEVVRIGARAFCGCGTLASVSIPAGVTSIGEDAFAECPALASIEVAEGNAKYASVDGVLYDKGKTRLLMCPPARIGPCTIPEGVVDISDHAFGGCPGLTAVQKGSARSAGTSSMPTAAPPPRSPPSAMPSPTSGTAPGSTFPNPGTRPTTRKSASRPRARSTCGSTACASPRP